MTTQPDQADWRPTWARLAIFREASSGRYKLYAVEESKLGGAEERTAARRQPPDGFKTLAEARAALAEADPAAELRRRRGHDGTPDEAPDGTELESVRACGDPRLRESKADPGGVPADLADAFRRLSAAVMARPGPGSALRITIGTEKAEVFLLETGDGPGEEEVGPAPRAACRRFTDEILEKLGMTTDELLERIVTETPPDGGGRGTPTRTLWNEPPLVVCGAAPTVIDALREPQTDRTREAPERNGPR